VAALSRNRKSLAAYDEPLSEAMVEFHAASRVLAGAMDRDAASFEAVMAAHRLPQRTPQEQQHRDGAIQSALAGAVEVPLEIARRAADIFERLGQLEPISSPSMLSDIRVGRLMAAAAVRGAIENVTINLESITDSDLLGRARLESQSLASRVSENPVIAGR
jgi:formiminotetrahydrofolate cyclodeaminase